MISERMKHFIEAVDYAFVASADQRSRPHLAAAQGLKVPDPQHVAFEAWFCHKTLENVAEVPRLAIVVVDRESGAGYQLTGLVESTAAVGMLNGYAPELEEPGMPQVETRILVRVEEILEFSQGPHSDNPIAAES
jgi:hypothetical protein